MTTNIGEETMKLVNNEVSKNILQDYIYSREQDGVFHRFDNVYEGLQSNEKIYIDTSKVSVIEIARASSLKNTKYPNFGKAVNDIRKKTNITVSGGNNEGGSHLIIMRVETQGLKDVADGIKIYGNGTQYHISKNIEIENKYAVDVQEIRGLVKVVIDENNKKTVDKGFIEKQINIEKKEARYKKKSSEKYKVLDGICMLSYGGYFICKKSHDKLSRESVINILKETGMKNQDAESLFKEHVFERVSGLMFFPQSTSSIVLHNGKKYFNTFKGLRELDSCDYTEEDIAPVTKHILNICNGNKEYAHHLTSYLAKIIQCAGEKIRWCPLIIGDEGTGKTFFEDLMQTLIGDTNVNKVSKTQLKTNFNSWATDYIINFCNELVASGNNRHEVHDSLKEMITDSTLSVTKKGQDSIKVNNFTNWFFTTNRNDCLPLKKNDRRFFVIDVLYSEKYMSEDYFNKLYDCRDKKYREILSYLRDYDISKFPVISPNTVHKKMIVSNENDKISCFTDVEEYIKDKVAISSKKVFNNVKSETRCTYGDVKKSLEALGYKQHNKTNLTYFGTTKCFRDIFVNKEFKGFTDEIKEDMF